MKLTSRVLRAILCILGCVYILFATLIAKSTNYIPKDPTENSEVSFGIFDTALEHDPKQGAFLQALEAFNIKPTREIESLHIQHGIDNGRKLGMSSSRGSKVRREIAHHSPIRGAQSGGSAAFSFEHKNSQPKKNNGKQVIYTPKLLREAKKQLSQPTQSTGEKPGEGLGICLLIRDDNDLLPEWIAYHYHALELRKLVVAVDPASQHSPTWILDRFKKELPDLSVDVWDDTNFMPPDFMKGDYSRVPNFDGPGGDVTRWSWGKKPEKKYYSEILKQKNLSAEEFQRLLSINNHRYRQVQFLGECTRHLYGKMSLNSTDAVRWLAHIDTDEFIVINPHILTTDKARYEKMALNENHATNGKDSRPWKTITPSSVLRFMERWLLQYPPHLRICFQVPRLLFGSRTEDNKALASHDVLAKPDYDGLFNTSRFETLRWKWHAGEDMHAINGYPKPFLDLTQINPETDQILTAKRPASSIHRLSHDLCPDPSDGRRFGAKPVTINHYLGSVERYLGKGDPRRSAAKHSQKSESASTNTTATSSEWLDQWLPRMIQEHGLEKVKRLLPEYYAEDTV